MQEAAAGAEASGMKRGPVNRRVWGTEGPQKQDSVGAQGPCVLADLASFL